VRVCIKEKARVNVNIKEGQGGGERGRKGESVCHKGEKGAEREGTREHAGVSN
jgi:hypothetical protein